ncbi:hypothetical protein OAJ02_07675, partial [Nitrosopumilus sp.]|nr:hypothetical protein [Nitrosopumilus sp.]
LKNFTQWREYCKSGEKPEDIPSDSYHNYKNKGWTTWGDFLGTRRVSNYNTQFLPFNEARKFVRSLGIKGDKEWREYCKSGNRPNNIPSSPWNVYKNKGYLNNGDFLGTGRIADRNKVFQSFTDARKFVRKLGLKTQKEWFEYCKSGDKPEDIPATPSSFYKNKGWTNWGDWLGTKRIATQNKVYRSYKEARKFVRSLGLKTGREWQEYCKSGDKPDDIPAQPWIVYKEWKKK